MAVAAGDVLEIRQPSSIGDSFFFLNVFKMLVVVVPPGGDDEVTADMLTYRDAVYTPLLSDYPTTWDTEGGTVLNLTRDEFVGEFATEVTGLGVGDVASYQVAALVVAPTANRGHQGRKFFGPFIEPSQAGSQWVAATFTQLQLTGDAYIADQTPVGGGVYSPGVWNAAELPVPIFRSFVRRKTIIETRTQRSRTRSIRF